MRSGLHSITLKGFKTVHLLESFELGPLTVLIGPNGAGKSNLISFFRMMSSMLADPNSLRLHVARQGGASKLLHNGPAATRQIESELTIRTDAGENQYAFRLVFAAGDALILADERFRLSRSAHPGTAPWMEMGPGSAGPNIIASAAHDETANVILRILRRFVVYQFHDTSATARIRTKWHMHDHRYLKEDAANIAPVLLRLKEADGRCYQRIVDTLRLILPFFSEFELAPDNGHVLLMWRERDSDQVFDVSQASDGMLRVMALVTLLLQPEENLPDVLMLDEPELGLHPYAITVIGGLIRAISTKTQVMVATQSTALVDCFEPEDIVVVEREDGRSAFRRLDASFLENWLRDHSLSELWEKNVIGGRP